MGTNNLNAAVKLPRSGTRFRIPEKGQALLLLCFATLAGAVCWFAVPAARTVVLLGASVVPAHALIAAIAHEPIALAFAQRLSPLEIAVAGSAGACIAGAVDYLFLPALINHPLLRRRYAHTRLFTRSRRLFNTSPMAVLAVSTAVPFLPSYPVKFISFAARCPFWKYTLAQAAGRFPRYYALALLGHAISPPGWLLALLLLAPLLLMGAKGWAGKFTHKVPSGQTRPPAPEATNPGDAVAAGSPVRDHLSLQSGGLR